MAKPVDERAWYLPIELCGYIGVGLERIYEMLRNNEIPNHRFGRLYRIPKRAFHEWFEGRKLSEPELEEILAY